MINIHIISHPRSGSTYLGLLGSMLYDAKFFSEPFGPRIDLEVSMRQIENFINSKEQSCIVKNQTPQLNILYNKNYYSRFLDCANWKHLALYRKNLFAVSCSFAFSRKTNHWLERTNHWRKYSSKVSINQVDYPIVIDQQEFADLSKKQIESVDNLFEYISNNPSIPVLCYEDLACNYYDDIGVFPWPTKDNYHIVTYSIETPVPYYQRISNILDCYTTFKQTVKQVKTKFYQVDIRDNII